MSEIVFLCTLMDLSGRRTVSIHRDRERAREIAELAFQIVHGRAGVETPEPEFRELDPETLFKVPEEGLVFTRPKPRAS